MPQAPRVWRRQIQFRCRGGWSDTSVRTMAAYIDLNPVRAGMVEDPKDYRWSGYGEAVAGGESARTALGWLVRTETGDDAPAALWAQVQAIYRCWLYDEGQEVRDEHGKVVKRGFAPESAEMVINRQQGALARPVLVKMRLRHFTEGVVIGSTALSRRGRALQITLRHIRIRSRNG